MRLEYTGVYEVCVPAVGAWAPGTIKEITDIRLAEGLLARADFREAPEEPAAVGAEPDGSIAPESNVPASQTDAPSGALARKRGPTAGAGGS